MKSTQSARGNISTTIKILTIITSLLVFGLFPLTGCSNQPPPPAQVAKAPVQQKAVMPAPAAQPAAEAEEPAQEGGYVYQRNDRRDPFVPLVVPKKQGQQAKAKEGTLESYDISEFSLAAVAKRGTGYFALLTTPDNRSFTVVKGTPIGLSKGRVKMVSKEKVILVEYSRDYKGELNSREIILEFRKGEVK